MTQEIFTLNKAIWTQDDYEQMDWHDCNIYGFTFLPADITDSIHLTFDIDYIFKWVTPILTEQTFQFWISPCSLCFKNVYDLEINIDKKGSPNNLIEIVDLELVDKVERRDNVWLYEWDIDLQDGYIKFKSFGFDQIVRHKPKLIDRQILRLDERHGICFDLNPCLL